MAESPTKLFHAIVGLGLAAAGCGDVRSIPEDTGDGRADAGGSRAQADAGSSAHRDAIATVDAHRETGTTFTLDARALIDTGVDVATPDAAREAATDVSQPPPPEIK